MHPLQENPLRGEGLVDRIQLHPSPPRRRGHLSSGLLPALPDTTGSPDDRPHLMWDFSTRGLLRASPSPGCSVLSSALQPRVFLPAPSVPSSCHRIHTCVLVCGPSLPASAVTEQDPVGTSWNRHQPCPPPASCLQKNFSLLGPPQVPKNKFNQRNKKMQTQRTIVKEGKITIV